MFVAKICTKEAKTEHSVWS